MATVSSFEDLEVWRKAIEIYKLVCELLRKPAFADEKRLKEQMRSSAGSIADNIAEGFERASRLEFSHSLFIAKGETGELRSQLHRCKIAGLIDDRCFQHIYNKLVILARQLYAFTERLKHSTIKGHKFKDRLP